LVILPNIAILKLIERDFLTQWYEDNLLDLRQRTFVPATTDANHRWRVVPTDFKPGITLTVHSIVSPLFGLN
jgi:hypothetical protein